jgi:CSLREA domain-containing protein
MPRSGVPIALALCLAAAPAPAAIFVAGSTSDLGDWAPGDGSCNASPIVGVTICTLRAAIQEANALPGDDAIHLYGETYSLNVAGQDADATAGDLDVTSTIHVLGSGVGETVIAQTAPDRVFELPFLGNGDLTLQNLTLRGGDAGDLSGGGVFVRDGTLVLDRVEITGCEARLGGGLFNYGTTQITDSWIHGNHADWRGGGVSSASTSASGFPTTTLVVEASTIGPNTAEFLPKEVELSNAGSATLTNVTITHADPLEQTVEIANQDTVLDHVTLRGELTAFSFDGSHTLEYSNSAIEYCFNLTPPAETPVTSRLGVNASENAGCQFAAAGGIEGPLGLAPLANRGGPTPTHRPATDSPLVDAADDARCAALDQRGVARPLDGDRSGAARCDVGALEVPEPGPWAAALAAFAVLRHLPRGGHPRGRSCGRRRSRSAFSPASAPRTL